MDSTCQRCDRTMRLRENCEPTPFCDECAHLEVERLQRELADENARMNHYRHKWQDAEREIQKLKDALAAMPNEKSSATADPKT